MTPTNNDILAIDPGTSLSAYVILSGDGVIRDKGKITNSDLLSILFFRVLGNKISAGVAKTIKLGDVLDPGVIAIELMQCYGNPVGKEVFETCYWIGRFIQVVEGNYIRVYRKDVSKYFLPEKKKDRPFKSTDANIRAKLISMYPKKDLVGFKADMWSALAIGRYVLDNDI